MFPRAGYLEPMDRTPSTPRAGSWFTLAAIATAVGLALVLVLLLTGTLLDSADDLVTFFLAGVAVVAVAGWWQDTLARTEREKAEAVRREQEDRDREERARARHEDHMRDIKTRARLERAHAAQREWVRELRGQVVRMHRERGVLGHTGDVRELVLETALRLVEADRGLLLSRRDEDGDGDFDMVCQSGFDGDATHSAVAQEFAGRVLKNDETVREDDSSKLRGAGRNEADDEIHNLLAIPIYMQDDFQGVVLCANREGGFEELDDDVLLALGDHAGAVLQNGRLEGELRSTYMAIVRMLAEAIEAKDPATRLHSEEVAEYVRGVSEGLELEPRQREELVIASLLHDVGKIGVSERILLKPGALTPDERAAVELHPKIGARLVAQVPALEGIGESVLHHHERWDGTGYPDGLTGAEIPLDARVICVADSFSAMTSARPYRQPMSVDDACAELERCAGEQFDPQVVKLFIAQVRTHPPGSRDGQVDLDGALADPEVQAQLEPGEPVVGYGPHAAVDSLTLLYAHRPLHERAERVAAESALTNLPVSVLLVELSSLAEINVRDGYAAGDRAIVQAAAVLAEMAARVNGSAYRYGGRRLALLVPAATEHEATALGRELERELEAAGLCVRTAAAQWRDGDPPGAPLGRARLGLRQREVQTPPGQRY